MGEKVTNLLLDQVATEETNYAEPRNNSDRDEQDRTARFWHGARYKKTKRDPI
jgi:hypothetical protein